MKSGRLLIAAVLFLGVGLWVLFEYCNGSAGLNFGNELSANRVSIDLTTTGVPMLVGFSLGRNRVAPVVDCVHRRNLRTVPATARVGTRENLVASRDSV